MTDGVKPGSGGPAGGTLGDVDPETLQQWLKDGRAVLVDVREANERAQARIEPSLFAPLSNFEGSMPDVGEPEKLVFYCRSGNRTGKAAERFLALGHVETFHLAGGILAWNEHGLPTKSGPEDS